MIDHLVRTDFKAVDKRDPIQTLYGYLRGEARSVPIVCDRGRPYGIPNEKRLLRARLSSQHHIERFVVGPGVLTPDAEVEEALELMAHEWVPHVPVWDGKRLLGYVTALDCLREIDAPLRAEGMLVEVPLVQPQESVGDVIHRFYEVASHMLPVLDGNGRLGAVITRRSLLPLSTDARPDGRKAAGGNVTDPRTSPVDGYLESRFETLHPSTDFGSTLDVLEDFGAGVVVDGGRIRGVVTPESAAKAVRLWQTADDTRASTLPLPRPRGRSEGMPG